MYVRERGSLLDVLRKYNKKRNKNIPISFKLIKLYKTISPQHSNIRILFFK